MGNLLSVRRGFERCGAKVTISSDPEIIIKSQRLVLPGVGAFPNAMSLLANHNLIAAIKEYGKTGNPLLAICLGMQLLMDESYEFARTPGLGLISGKVVAIPEKDSKGIPVKIPHIGWSPLLPSDSGKKWKDTILRDNLPKDSVYFVHSFMIALDDSRSEVAFVNYGENRITSVITSNQFHGCQFHPEKSGEVGLRILKNFCHV